MRKAEYKKIATGPIWLKADLDMRYFLRMKRERKRWMKTALSRYERRRGKKGVNDVDFEPRQKQAY